MKKYLLMTMLMLVNLVAWGETQVQISTYETTVAPGFNKFQEPTVTVVETDGAGHITDVVTNRFNFTYLIKDKGEGDITTNSKGAKITKDDATGTTVEYLFGDVIFGTAGSVTIEVIATPKSGFASLYPSAPFKNEYSVNIQALTADVVFAPEYSVVSEQRELTFNAAVALAPWSDQYVVNSQSTTLPVYKVVYSNGVDITDRFDCSISYASTAGHVSYANNTLTFAGSNGTRYATEAAANGVAAAMEGKDGTLTYTFAPKAEYTGVYSNIVKTVDVKIAAKSGKDQLHLYLDRNIITEDNVTTADNTCTVHVYKYGYGDPNVNHNYQYFTPNPVLLTSTGVTVPMYAKRGTGNYGDFQYLYKIVEDNTYYDNCRYAPFWNNEEDVAIQAGQPTGLTISDDKFQVNHPGLVKVAVYAVLPEDPTYGATLRTLYDPYKIDGETVVLDGQWGTKYIAYTEPVYFYIDVMKRVPELLFDPNPNNMVFAAGDKIDMKNRFTVYGHIDDNSNGIEGWLLWGANTGNNAVYDPEFGHEVDHFAYTFHISDRNATNIKIENWPYYNGKANWDANGGDQYSYYEWTEIKEGNSLIGTAVQVGDKIKVAEGTGDNGTDYVLVTEENLASKYSTTTLKEGDMERGITYYSTKGYGEAFEKWTMTFQNPGTYTISYTIHPYNHTRWDVGANGVGTVTYTYEVKKSVDTKIDLSYTYTTTPKCKAWEFNEPVAKVVVPTQNNYDVTEYFDLHYDIPSSYNGGSNIPDDKKVLFGTENIPSGEHEGTYSVYYLVDKSAGAGTSDDVILKINQTTGEVYVGCAWTGNVVIKVSGTKKTDDKHIDAPYNEPKPEYYTIRIYDPSHAAEYEIISTCRVKDETPDYCETPATNNRFANVATEVGRFHFIRPGELYGGTVYRGVPGIDMTLGAEPKTTTDVADWTATATTLDVAFCCSHEDGDHKPVAVQAGDVIVDEEGIPTGGTFYKFTPSTNGYLSVDANWKNGEVVYLVSKNSKTGEIVSEEIRVTDDKQGDLIFEKALIAGEEYYLYNRTAGWLRLHGFAYQPAFVFDRNTTKEQSTEPLKATTFMNGLSSGIPTIINTTNSNVTFASEDDETVTVGEHNGAITPLKMTVQGDGTIAYVRISAVVKSSDASLGDCVVKNANYDLRIIDIPSYVVGQASTVAANDKYHAVTPQTPVTTTNIPTAITMTFGGWKRDYSDTGDEKYQKNPTATLPADMLTDGWDYKSKEEGQDTDKDASGTVYNAYKELYSKYTLSGTDYARPADRIGSELADYDPTYNKTIDGFNFFMGATQNAIDERGYSPLTSYGGNVYNYSSGTAAENERDANGMPYYNTTYRIPCKGAYVKFEPEESGIVMVYLVQNGSIDYHHGIANDDIITFESDKLKNKYHRVSWRPLYITDETGKPVEMVNDFGGAAQYMMNYEDKTNMGSYTLGLSRCNHQVDAIENDVDYKAYKAAGELDLMPGCSFDWSDFRGTQADRAKLLASWPAKGERESVIRLDDGGFALAHKAYVRYAFRVMAGKSYFVFQLGSKFEFGGFSFVPEGYPETSKYGLTWTGAAAEKSYREDVANIANCTSWVGQTNGSNQETNLEMPWHSSSDFGTLQENYNITVKDGAEITAATRAIKNNSWTSICLPFSVSEKQCKKLFGDDYFLLTAAGVDSKGQIHFERHAHKYIEAGRPYLLKPSSKANPTGTEDINFVFHNVTIEGSRSTFLDPARFNVNAQEYTFKGVYTQETMPKGSVITGGVGAQSGLYTFTKDYPIGGYRAYYYLPAGVNPAVSPAKAFAYVDLTEDGEEDNATGIIYFGEDGDIQIFPKNTAVYNIGGQKMGEGIDALNRLQKGLYIVNGKKFLVK